MVTIIVTIWQILVMILAWTKSMLTARGVDSEPLSKYWTFFFLYVPVHSLNKKFFYTHFISWLSTFCNAIRIIMNCTYTTMNSLTFRHMSTICSPFSGRLTASHFSSILIVFRRVITGITLKWCRFTFLTHVGKKRQCCRRGNQMSLVNISLT